MKANTNTAPLDIPPRSRLRRALCAKINLAMTSRLLFWASDRSYAVLSGDRLSQLVAFEPKQTGNGRHRNGSGKRARQTSLLPRYYPKANFGVGAIDHATNVRLWTGQQGI